LVEALPDFFAAGLAAAERVGAAAERAVPFDLVAMLAFDLVEPEAFALPAMIPPLSPRSAQPRQPGQPEEV